MVVLSVLQVFVVTALSENLLAQFVQVLDLTSAWQETCCRKNGDDCIAGRSLELTFLVIQHGIRSLKRNVRKTLLRTEQSSVRSTGGFCGVYGSFMLLLNGSLVRIPTH